MKNKDMIKGLVLAAGSFATLSALAATQQIPLEAGWNLISLQVCPDGIAVSELPSFIDDSDVLKAVWDYDVESGTWKTYQPDYPQVSSDLTRVVPGRGYWVKVRNACVLTLEGDPWDGSVALSPGWNLVGFPGLQETKIASFFQDQLSVVDQIWCFEGGYVGKFVGYDVTAVPMRKDLEFVGPGKGYWVYAHDRLILAPNPQILLTGDFDLPPLQSSYDEEGEPIGRSVACQGRTIWECGIEDAVTDLNGNGLIDDAWTQDTISFSVGVERQPIILCNLADENKGLSACGAFNWSVEENCNWLSVEGASSGSVSIGTKYVYLSADRSELPAGVYTNRSLVVRAGDVMKNVTVILHVATVAGDFKGYASATKVNGKSIPLGKVDMGLNLFMQSDEEDETRFKAVVDKNTSLLFPRDVFMNGVFYFDNCFSLTTSFTMPASDRNAPPYDVFRHVEQDSEDPAGLKDKDWNGDGVLNVDNPFPYPVRRSITLFGERKNENTLEGTYIETIAGMLPDEEKVCIEGTFSLDRRTYAPSQDSIYNGNKTLGTAIGGSRKMELVDTITIDDAVKIQKTKVTLNFDFSAQCELPTHLTITLTSPTDKTVTLYDHEHLIHSQVRELSDFDGELGKGDWTLRIAWDIVDKATFHSWSLSLGGVATYSVSGTLVDENQKPVSGATVTLTGNNEIEGRTTDSEGHFTFDGLTEDDYAIFSSRPGYDGSRVTFEIERGDLTLGPAQIRTCGSGWLSGLVARPSYGVAPLDVDFVVGYQPLRDEKVTAVDWKIVRRNAAGGETTEQASSAVVADSGCRSWTTKQHFDEDVYSYDVHAVITTDDGQMTEYKLLNVGVAHNGLSKSRDPHLKLTHGYLSQCGFIGGGTWPTNSFPCVTAADTNAVEYAQMKRDCATFDINRWPTDRFVDVNMADHSQIIGEDTDFYVPTDSRYYSVAKKGKLTVDRDGLCTSEDLPLSGKHFRMTSTIGGWVFSETPCRADGRILQCGRIED